MAGVGWDLASPSLQPSGKAFGPEEPNQMDHRFLGCCPFGVANPTPRPLARSLMQAEWLGAAGLSFPFAPQPFKDGTLGTS